MYKQARESLNDTIGRSTVNNNRLNASNSLYGAQNATNGTNNNNNGNNGNNSNSNVNGSTNNFASYPGVNSNSNNSSSFGNQDSKSHVKINLGDNKIILLNSNSTCLHMVNYLKEQINLNKDDLLDLIDFDGNLKELPNTNNKDYAISYLSPSASYVVLKIEYDSNNEKKYTPLINENRLNANMMKTLATLNTGKNLTARDKAKLTREAKERAKQQQQQQQSQPQQPQAQQQQQQQQAPQLQQQLSGGSNLLNSTNQTGNQTNKKLNKAKQ